MKLDNNKKYLTLTKDSFLSLSSTKDTNFLLTKTEGPPDKDINKLNTYTMENYLKNTFSKQKNKKPTYFTFCWFFILLMIEFYILILVKKYK